MINEDKVLFNIKKIDNYWVMNITNDQNTTDIKPIVLNCSDEKILDLANILSTGDISKININFISGE